MLGLLESGLTAPLKYKIIGLVISMFLFFGLTMAAVASGVITEMGITVAAVQGIGLGMIGLMIAGRLARGKSQD